MKYNLNPNAQALFNSKAMPVVHSTFLDYIKTLSADRKLMPSRIFKDEAAKKSPLMWRALEQVIRHLCDAPEPSAQVLSALRLFMNGYFVSNPQATQAQFERDCREKMSSLIPNFEARLQNKLVGGHAGAGRSGLIFSQISPYLLGNTVLDIGAGDGKVGGLVESKLGKFVRLVDVLDYNTTALPLDLYDGLHLPYADKQFDTSIVSVVFHHADHPLDVLQETIRVTNKRIVAIESVYFNEEHRQLNAVLDWFYNRVLHANVNCPFNFQTPWGWEDTFRSNGLKISASVDLGIDQPLAPEYHWLFALDVR
jgi:ubiquinone/menaquinone biosynthesis C-methylase UbiE